MEGLKPKLLLSFGAGLFLSFVLYVYEAFGIAQGLSFSGHSLLQRSMLFGAGVSASYLLNELVLAKQIKLESLKRRLIWFSWEVWTASLITFFLFNYFWNFTELSWYAYSLLLSELVGVMLVPHFVVYFMSEKRKFVNTSLIKLQSENGKDYLIVKEEDLLYVRAEDNYVRVLFKKSGGKKVKLLRQTLSQIEKHLNSSGSFIRIHRSYLVNAGAICSIERTPKRTAIHMEFEEVLPVSQKYLSELDQIHPK